MASNRIRKKRASDDELVKALLETTGVDEAAHRVGVHPTTVRRRLRSPLLQGRLEAARRALEINAGEQAVDPKEGRVIQARWKHQAELYGERIPGGAPPRRDGALKTAEDRARRWLLALVGFTARLIWAAFHLFLLLAAISVLLLLALFIGYARVH